MKTVIQLLVLDIDGVLTDGSDSVIPGEKRLYLRDLDALTAARREGLEIAFLTGESEEFAGRVVERCGGGPALYRMKNKAEGMTALVERQGVTMEQVCYLADGERDVPALEMVGLALAPADASEAARAVADRVLAARGGRGAVEEAVALLRPGDIMDGDELTAFVRGDLNRAAEGMQALARGDIGNLVQAVEIMGRALAAGGKIVIFGNGGSAAISQHIATELVGRYRRERGPLPAIALTADTALLTALANDFGFDAVFERQVHALVRWGDAVIAMSTSGRSPNVVRALEAAAGRGARTIALVGSEPGEVGALAQCCVTFDSSDTARIQEQHLAALHVACACLEISSFDRAEVSGDRERVARIIEYSRRETGDTPNDQGGNRG